MSEENPVAFNNGLTAEQADAIDDLIIDINRLTSRVEDLGRHRNYSLVVTKLDEARLWLRDRKNRAA